jgi:hypothetical protein
VVDADLHPADVIAHDEQDVGLLLLMQGPVQARELALAPGSEVRTRPAKPLRRLHRTLPN